MKSFGKYLYLTLCVNIGLLLCCFQALGQPPAGYYNPAQGLYGLQLKAALHDIIDGHTSVTYQSLYAYFQQTDIKTGNIVWDIYSDIPSGTPPYTYYYNNGDECGNYTQEGDCFNREHSWPNSWFGGEVMPMYSDLFHLYPTDGYVNNRRANYPFGKVGTSSWTSQNGSKVGNCISPGYSGTVFEPIDEYKGDFARSYFYMSTRYYSEDAGWPGSDMTNGADLLNWARTMLLLWHQQDPVSQKETDRNNLVYGIQNNRNPFIDNPQFVNDIWEEGAGISESDNKHKLDIYPNPAKDQCIILLPDIKSGMILELSDVSGRLIKTIDVGHNPSYVLCVNELLPGTYFLNIICTEVLKYHAIMIKQ